MPTDKPCRRPAPAGTGQRSTTSGSARSPPAKGDIAPSAIAWHPSSHPATGRSSGPAPAPSWKRYRPRPPAAPEHWHRIQAGTPWPASHKPGSRERWRRRLRAFHAPSLPPCPASFGPPPWSDSKLVIPQHNQSASGQFDSAGKRPRRRHWRGIWG